MFNNFAADPDADADEDEGHISNDNEKDINKDKERIEDDTLLDEQGSPDQPNNEISISLLRAKNLSLLQSQLVLFVRSQTKLIFGLFFHELLI